MHPASPIQLGLRLNPFIQSIRRIGARSIQTTPKNLLRLVLGSLLLLITEKIKLLYTSAGHGL